MQKNNSRVWFITGCSSGFGRQIAEAALAQGDRVIVTARNINLISDLEQKYPETAKCYYLDVTDNVSIHNSVKSGLEAFGCIDVLVNNAGYMLIGTIEEASEQQIRDQFNTNFFGLLNVSRAVIPIMRKQASGHIINFSSVSGRTGTARLGFYQASKHAIEGVSESLVL